MSSGDTPEDGDRQRGALTGRVLYFPYISVPASSWLTRALLYWDEVGSIVPTQFNEDLTGLAPHMAELVRAGLVRPVVPEQYESQLWKAMEPFVEFVEHDPEIQRRAELPLGTSAVRRGSHEGGTVFDIHLGKFSIPLMELLLDKRLARRTGDDWLEVESRTAGAYMAFLAAALGGLPEVGMDPMTDDTHHISPYAPDVDPDDPLAIADELRVSVLEGVLPGPYEDVSVPELVAFKERHGDLLSRFRRRIELEVLELALLPHDGARYRKLSLLKEQLDEEVDEIVAAMEARKWPQIVFGTLCGFVASAMPLALGVAAHSPPDIVGGATGLANVVYEAYDRTQSQKKRTTHPLAYAALARSKLQTSAP